MITLPNIVCVWYPSGGFGHFVNSVLTMYGKDFVRPKKKQLEFSPNGNSHNLDLVASKYMHDPAEYKFEFNQPGIYSVLVDNGIGDESRRFFSVFPNAKVIKICYSDRTWPVVARTMIEKAMVSDMHAEVGIDEDAWDSEDDWAQREKYFLFLRDHNFRSGWREDPEVGSLSVENIMIYAEFRHQLHWLGIETESFEDKWQDWAKANNRYIEPVTVAERIVKDVHLGIDRPVSLITDLWTQAVVNYYIWLDWGYEVPANDYADWFKTTGEIVEMLKSQ